MNRTQCRAVQFRKQQTGIAVARGSLVLNLFKMDPERVRWDLAEAADGSCRLTVHHARGTVVESFRTAELALARIYKLEELLLRALEDDFTHPRSTQ